MENYEYNRLIFNNQLDELSNITNISDLIRYKYRNKYLIEHLLEKNIHTKRMDSYAILNREWAKYYIQYNIIKPLTKISLEILLEKEDDKLFLEKVLSVMTNEEKIELYRNFKYTSVWLYRHMEREIIDIYQKHGINIDRTFIALPQISDNNIKINGELKLLIGLFKQAYSDMDEYTLNTIVEELKRKSKNDKYRTSTDITKLIAYKYDNPDFKIKLNSNEVYIGEFSPLDKVITTDKYIPLVFHHELSHMLFYIQEEENIDDMYSEYCAIRKEITKKSTISKIVNYLKVFHRRVKYMKKVFAELYYAEINRQYGSFNNYALKIYNEIEDIKPEVITIDNDITSFYIDKDDILDTATEIIESECDDYVDICTKYYYIEELMLENLLDAVLRGRIHGRDYSINCLSGHSKNYFKSYKYASLDECLADYDAIKSSKRSDIIIDKLIELVGEDLVIFLDNYLEHNRGSKIKR